MMVAQEANQELVLTNKRLESTMEGNQYIVNNRNQKPVKWLPT